MKQWLKAKTPHIIAIISVSALAVIGVFYASQELTNFIDREFIQAGQSSVQVFTK